jgi:hypothetical protein
MSNFIFLQGLCIFAFYAFSIIVVLSVLLFQGVNKGSFAATCVALPVVVLGISCSVWLRKYWACHTGWPAKVGILAFAGLTALLNYAVFFLPTQLNPYAVLLGLSSLSVMAATVSLLTNLSYPFVIALDSSRHRDDIGRLNELLETGDSVALSDRARRRLSAIRSGWRLLDASGGAAKSQIDVTKLRRHIAQLEQLVARGKEPPTKEQTRDTGAVEKGPLRVPSAKRTK